jgi:hypothetical protein
VSAGKLCVRMSASRSSTAATANSTDARSTARRVTRSAQRGLGAGPAGRGRRRRAPLTPSAARPRPPFPRSARRQAGTPPPTR